MPEITIDYLNAILDVCRREEIPGGHTIDDIQHLAEKALRYEQDLAAGLVAAEYGRDNPIPFDTRTRTEAALVRVKAAWDATADATGRPEAKLNAPFVGDEMVIQPTPPIWTGRDGKTVTIIEGD